MKKFDMTARRKKGNLINGKCSFHDEKVVKWKLEKILQEICSLQRTI